MRALIFIAFIGLSFLAQGQDRYWVFFGQRPLGQESSSPALSEKAEARRAASNIQLEASDFPVSPNYVNQIKQTGAQVHTVSRWFNAVSVLANADQLEEIQSLPFVEKMQGVLRMQKTEVVQHAELALRVQKTAISEFSYGPSANQIELLNGDFLHNQNYLGQDMLIAVLDGGFNQADVVTVFDSARADNRIVATYNFVRQNSNVYQGGAHGTSVLSTIIGFQDGQLVGAAPLAKVVLLTSEDESQETSLEEDNWVAAAEFADSIGASVINSSLGYNTFDGGNGNYDLADLDGRTAITSRAAVMAARKGILVVNSAGNEGSGFWQKIITPADADSILAVGGVDASGNYVQFASRGPSADGRVKPDIAAQASGVYFVRESGLIGSGSGTSFAAPVISGLAACLWQKHPDATAWEIRDAIIRSASRYTNPNNQIGYGIPNFSVADAILSDTGSTVEPDDNVLLMPNPFVDELTLFVRSENYPLMAELIVNDMQGNLVAQERFEVVYKETDLSKYARLASGMYIFEVRINDQVHHFKMIR